MAQSNNTSASLSEYLGAVTENVSQAQQQLSRRQIPGHFGQPATGYQMSKVDFDLKLWIDSSMGVQPVNGYSPSPQSSNVIKGSLIAIPKEGLGSMINLSSTFTIDGQNLQITVKAQSTGDNMSVENLEVRFMLDLEVSQELNGSLYQFAANTKLDHSLRQTDLDGVVLNRLIIDPNEPSGTYIAIIIEASGELESVVYQRP